MSPDGHRIGRNQPEMHLRPEDATPATTTTVVAVSGHDGRRGSHPLGRRTGRHSHSEAAGQTQSPQSIAGQQQRPAPSWVGIFSGRKRSRPGQFRKFGDLLGLIRRCSRTPPTTQNGDFRLAGQVTPGRRFAAGRLSGPVQDGADDHGQSRSRRQQQSQSIRDSRPTAKVQQRPPTTTTTTTTTTNHFAGGERDGHAEGI